MEGHVYPRGATYTYVVDLPKDPLTNKRRQKSKGGFKTEEAAELAMDEIILKLKKGTYRPDTKMTVEQYFRFWLEHYSKVRHRETTYETNSIIIESRIIPEIGMHKLKDLTADHIELLLSKLLKKYKSSYVHGIFRIIRSALRRAYFKWNLFTENIMDKVEAPSVEKRKYETWTLEQCQVFLTAAEQSPYYSAYLITINSGLRRGEVLGYRELDVSIKYKYLEINQTMNYNKRLGFFTQPPKTPKSERRMPIVDEYILEKLEEKINSNREQALLLGDQYQDWEMLINCLPDGSPISPGKLRYDYKKIIAQTDLPYIRFHDLRHSFATNLWELGYDLKDIGELLGHSSIVVTGDIYTHMRDEKKVSVMSGFSNAMKNAKKK